MLQQLFRALKEAPPTAPIQDSATVQRLYGQWRWRVFYSMFLGYAFFYFSRKSFTFAMPALVADLGFDKGQLGFLATILSLSYGLSKFLSGILGDRANARYFMALGLILTGVCNILFGLSSSILWFAVFWGLNGWFQGFGWPPCARLLTHWYSHSERGSWWASWNVSHNVGGAIIPIIAALCATYWGWRYAMYVPGALCIGMGFVLINRLRDTPESLGLPPIEEFKGDAVAKDVAEESEKPSIKEILVQHVLKNRYIWLLAFAYLFVYIVRIGFNDWTAFFLVESKGYSTLGANACVSLFEVGGFFGSLVAGWMSDRVFHARRGPVNAIYAFGIFGSILFFWSVPAGYSTLDSVAMFLVGFTVFGPQMLIGVHAAELSHKKAAATSTGFIGWFAYTGSAIAGYPLGVIAEQWGWHGYFVAVSVCCAISILLLLPLWSAGAVVHSEPAPEAQPEIA